VIYVKIGKKDEDIEVIDVDGKEIQYLSLGLDF
jgi:hypothetical protein